MNHIFKTYYNRALGTWVAVPETACVHGKSSTRADKPRFIRHALAAALFFVAVPGLAAPVMSNGTGNNSLTISPNPGTPPTQAQAIGTDDIAVGRGSKADSNKIKGPKRGAIAIGGESQSVNKETIAIGYGTIAQESQGIAIGAETKALGDQSTALGNNVRASGNSSVAIGGDDLDTVSTGATGLNTSTTATTYKDLTGADLVDRRDQYRPTTTGEAAVAVGVQSQATGSLSTAFGTKTTASGLAATALGVGANASKNNAVALGSGSTTTEEATGVNSAEIGTGASKITYTGFAGGARIQGGDQVSVGSVGYERQIKHVAPGAINADSTDAINGSQLYAIANNMNFKVNADNNDVKTHQMTKELLFAAGNTAEATSSANLKTEVKQDASSGKTTVTIKMKEAPEFTSVTAKDTAGNKTVMNSTGLAITATGSNPVSLTKDGLNNGGNKITKVKAGEDDDDAVNVKQLNTSISNSVNAARTHYYSVNDGNNRLGNYNNDGATGTNALAAGTNATAGTNRSVAMGNGAKATSSDSNHSGLIAVGDKAQALNDKAIAIGQNSQTDGYHAIAVGVQAKAKEHSAVAVGTVAEAQGIDDIAIGNKANADGSNNVVIGSYAHTKAVQPNTPLGHSTVIGTRAHSGNNHTVSIGSMASSRGQRSIAVGSYSYAQGDGSNALGYQSITTSDTSRNQGKGTHSTAIGTGTVVSGNDSGGWGAAGHQNPGVSYDNSKRSYIGGTGNYAIGNRNVIGGQTSNSVVFGNDIHLGADGANLNSSPPVGNDISGRKETVSYTNERPLKDAVVIGNVSGVKADGGTAVGAYAQVEDKYGVAIGGGAGASSSVVAKGEKAVAIGHNAGTDGENAVALGSGARATAENAQASGTNASAAGADSRAEGSGAKAIGERSQANGYQAVAFSQSSVASGDNASAVGVNAVASGTNASTDGLNARSEGTNAVARGENALASGTNASATADNTVATGSNTSASASGSVALGAESTADRAARAPGAAADETATAANGKVYAMPDADAADAAAISATVKGDLGAVSVGDAGNTRQIINVAAGSEDSDAVNVAQLKAVASKARGTTVNNTYVTQVVNNTKISAGKNIRVRKNGDDYNVALADDITLNSVTTGDARMSPDGFAIAGNSLNRGGLTINGDTYVSADGLNANNRTIQNVAPGRIAPDSQDAVNGAQLYALGQRMDGMGKRIDSARAGVASAIATAGLPQAYRPGASMIAAAGGYYDGQSAVAVGLSTISDNGRWIIKGAANVNSKEAGASIGVGYQW